MGYKAWRTPHGDGTVFDDLNNELHFTMDAAASHMNALLPIYCTEEGKFQRGVTGHMTQEISKHDGLSSEAWVGERVFCNPPYDIILPWVEIANLRVAEVSALLLPPSIDTAWYKALIPRKPDPEDNKANKMVVTTRVEDGPNGYFATTWWETSRTELKKFRELRQMHNRIRFWRPKRVLADDSYDETDPESVPGDSPRAGNIVVITWGRQ